MLIFCKFNRKDIFSYDVYGVQELSTVVLTQLIVLQLQFKMEFRFSHDHFASIFLLYIQCNYNHSGTQYPCFSEMFFLNYLFCNKLRRSVKFQHAINPSGPDLFQCKPLTFRLSFTESCMISNGRTYRNCLNLSNQDTGQDTHRSFLFCFACFLKKNKDPICICGTLLLLMTKFLISRSSCLFH